MIVLCTAIKAGWESGCVRKSILFVCSGTRLVQFHLCYWRSGILWAKQAEYNNAINERKENLETTGFSGSWWCCGSNTF